jgi:hypothetical protein
MGEIERKHFYERLEGAPLAAFGFFESIIQHFERDNVVDVHFTDANGGDLRLAIPSIVLNKKSKRNFASMYWQKKNKAVFARAYLLPDELALFGFDGATKPKSATEPLRSDVRLGEDVWRYRTLDFIRALKASQMQMAN